MTPKLCHQCNAIVPNQLQARGDNGPQHVEANPRCGIEEDLSFCSETCFFAWEDGTQPPILHPLTTYPSIIEIIATNPLKVYIPNWAPIWEPAAHLIDDSNKHVYHLSEQARQDLGLSGTLEAKQWFKCRIPMRIEKADDLRFSEVEQINPSTDESRARTLKWLEGGRTKMEPNL